MAGNKKSTPSSNKVVRPSTSKSKSVRNDGNGGARVIPISGKPPKNGNK